MTRLVIVTTNKVPIEGIMGLTKDGKPIIVRRAEMFSEDILDEEFVLLLLEYGFADVYDIDEFERRWARVKKNGNRSKWEG